MSLWTVVLFIIGLNVFINNLKSVGLYQFKTCLLVLHIIMSIQILNSYAFYIMIFSI